MRHTLTAQERRDGKNGVDRNRAGLRLGDQPRLDGIVMQRNQTGSGEQAYKNKIDALGDPLNLQLTPVSGRW